MSWTLADIKIKVRNLTGAPDSNQLSDADLTSYINNYYVFTMPFELKEQITLQFLDFKTTSGTDVYSFPGTFLTDQPGAYADGYPIVFYQSPDVFYQDYPQQYAVDSLATGDGVTTGFSGGLQNPPVIMGTLFITDGTQILQDQGNGTLTGDGSGTINYTTGAYTVNFNVAPSSAATIYGKYEGYNGDRPSGVLFFDNEFTLRPVPDQVYQIRMQGYINITPLTSAGDTPLQEEWGQLIAYGAALEIFSDRGDLTSYNQYYDILKRYENVALGRTVQQFQSQQSLSRF